MGFQNDATSKFIGRYINNGLIVDFMPLKEEVLGFSNKWYAEAFENAITEQLDEHVSIKIFTAPYFIATKLEAFKNRGRNIAGDYDGRVSTDFEDIVFLLVNRRISWEEMSQTSAPLKRYLQKEFEVLLENPYFEEWIDAHTDYNLPTAQIIVLPQAGRFIQQR